MFIEYSCVDFTDRLSSKSPVPGGGGASAMVGALGIALGSMVCNYTIGKKKYKNVEEDVRLVLQKAKKLQDEYLELVDRDAEVFKPLSRAYKMPKKTKEERIKKAETMEQSLKNACTVPLRIMEISHEAINLHEELANKGSKIVISDVGVGVLFCKAALQGGSLNVYINTSSIKDTEFVEKANKKAMKLLDKGIQKADRVYENIQNKIYGRK